MENLEKHENNDENNDIIDSSQNTIPQNKIKHLVISGGSIWGFYAYGAIKHACQSGFVNLHDIRSIFATSVGAIFAVVLALKFDFDTIDDYLIKRPWHNVWKTSAFSVLEAYHNRGFFHRKFFEDFFSPLFKSLDLSLDITMMDLYEHSGIDIHIFTTELNRFELIDISHKTHPDWKVIDAVHASSSLPLLFSPFMHDNHCYIDGGFFLNYPISKCLEVVENRDEILGISLGNCKEEDFKNEISAESTLFDFTMVLYNRIIKKMMFLNDSSNIPYEIKMYSPGFSIDYLYNVVSSMPERKKLIDNGIDGMKEHFNLWFSNNIEEDKKEKEII